MIKGERPYELALFTGAGGGLLGSRLLGWRTICYVEREPYPVEVLKARIKDGYLDDAPIWDDVRTFDGRPWAGLVDVISAGFPCQPWSTAGKQLGELDERNLWPDTLRIIREVRPQWVLLENVANLLSRLYIQQIFGDLAESGCDARWDCIPAAAVGAPHIRDRAWIVAHSRSESGGLQLQQREDRPEAVRGGEALAHSNGVGRQTEVGLPDEQSLSVWSGRDVPDANGVQHKGGPSSIKREASEIVRSHSESERCDGWAGVQATSEQAGRLWVEGNCPWWAVEPNVGRVANGVAHRVDRLAAIGAGQVPAVVGTAWRLLSGLKGRTS
jgi:DNA (cytosine-5)-methyltransferase 1